MPVRAGHEDMEERVWVGLGGAHTLSGASGPLPFPCSSSLIKSCAITSTWKDAFSVFPQPFLYVIMQVCHNLQRQMQSHFKDRKAEALHCSVTCPGPPSWTAVSLGHAESPRARSRSIVTSGCSCWAVTPQGAGESGLREAGCWSMGVCCVPHL